MRTVTEIYDGYRIPPWLQLHQLRVAAVGSILADAHTKADKRMVILTCLFHDMGNILKFDLSPDGPLAPLMGDTVAHWQAVKDDFARAYGPDEHVATIAIARELHLPSAVVALMQGISFSKMEQIRTKGPLELQICEYADMRVGPYGILPLQERVADLKARSRRRWAEGYAKDMEEKFDHSAELLDEIEAELFAGIPLTPGDITDESMALTIDGLKRYEI